ncbi:FkbM family methyltransferase [Chryseolinea sp. T2]|uniref:FkbM family methyltransferase n=1 Tax=Chryseolinea sp. T2 TaxID=3129255 RepID=UPI0030788196
MSGIKNLIRRILRATFSKESVIHFLKRVAHLFSIDLLPVALNQRGILNYSTPAISGELYFVNSFLPSLFPEANRKLVFLDVGANQGNYSILLSSQFPEARIFAFEPNPTAYQKLVESFKGAENDRANIYPVPLGLGSTPESKTMFSYSDDPSSEHASVHKGVFSDSNKLKSVVAIDTEFTTLDSFCEMKQFDCIDLLKIDTEGHEYEVLKGSARMLNNGSIRVIQFEFGECNVYSRVFLKDFYDLLQGYEFYRLGSNRLIPLRTHSAINEIFQFQNIVAVNAKWSHLV